MDEATFEGSSGFMVLKNVTFALASKKNSVQGFGNGDRLLFLSGF